VVISGDAGGGDLLNLLERYASFAGDGLRARSEARRMGEPFFAPIAPMSGIMFKLESLKRAEIAERGSPVSCTAPASAANSNRRDQKAGKTSHRQNDAVAQDRRFHPEGRHHSYNKKCAEHAGNPGGSDFSRVLEFQVSEFVART